MSEWQLHAQYVWCFQSADKCLTCVGPLQAAPIQNLVLPASLARNAACSDSRQTSGMFREKEATPCCWTKQQEPLYLEAAWGLFRDLMFMLLVKGTKCLCTAFWKHQAMLGIAVSSREGVKVS